MAAAVVPSRARAQARQPPASSATDPLTYIRVTLHIDTLQGSTLSSSPARYYFQWMRAGTAAKVSAAKSIQPTGVFSEKMALYARVRRHATTFVSEDPAEPLLTQLVLVKATDAKDPNPIATADFDIAKYLASTVAAKTKTVNDTLELSNIATATVTITIKAIGENHLFTQPSTSNSVPSSQPNSESTEMDEATAAIELEKLRQEIREKGKRISSLEQSANRIDTSIQQPRQGRPTTSGSNSEFEEKITSLEERLKVAENDRAVAENKVTAHVTHAAKIKETYNQLAAWYNNLRQEHAALQEKHTNQNNPSSSSAVDDEAYKNLEKERDELRQKLDQELHEKKDINSRNSQLLETKARTLAELRDQWDASQNELQQAKQQAEENQRIAKDMKDSVEDLKKQLTEKENQLEENKRSLTETQSNMRDVEARHLQAITMSKTDKQAVEEEAKESARKEIEALKLKYDEELEKVRKEKAAMEESLTKTEREKAKEELNKALETCKLDMTTSFDEARKQEFETLRKEYEEKLENEKNDAVMKVRELEEKSTRLNIEKETLEREKQELDLKMKDIGDDHEGRLEELSVTIQSIRDEHIQKVAQLSSARDVVIKELEQLKEASSKNLDDISEQNKSLNENISTLTQKCQTLQSELDASQKENEKMRSSPRQIDIRDDSEMEQIGARLNDEISELKALLKTEADKRSETAALLARADKEHDELREMVARLRSERDQALSEAKNTRDQVPNLEIKHASVQRNGSSGADSQEVRYACEERDEAIHELFKVRKALNREIKRLKKENVELIERGGKTEEVSRSAPVSLNGVDVSKVEAERDQALNDVNNLKESIVQTEADIRMKSEKIVELEDTLSNANMELSEMKYVMEGINSKLLKAEEEMRTHDEALSKQKEEFSVEVSKLQEKLTLSSTKVKDQEAIIAKLETDAVNANRAATDSSHTQDQLIEERNNALSKVTALTAELDSLKASHAAMSSSTTSTESLLKEAQQELAERKSEVEVLKLELAAAHQASEKKLAEMSAEFSTFKEQQLNQVSKLKEAASAERKELEDEREKRINLESTTMELENQIKTVENTNMTLQRELSSTKEQSTQLERQVSDGKSTTANLDGKYQELLRKENQQKEDITTLRRKQQEDSISLRTLNEKLSLLKTSSNDMTSELESVHEKLQVSERTNSELSRELESVMEEKETLMKKVDTAKAEIDEWKRQLEDTTNKLEETTKNQSDMSKADSTAIDTLRNLNENLKSKCSSLENKITSTEEELSKTKESNSVLSVRLTTLERQISELEASRAKHENTIKSVSGQLENAISDRENIDEEYRKLELEFAELEQTRTDYEAEANSAVQEKSRLEKHSNQLERNVSILQKRLSQMREENEKSLAEMRSASDRDTRTANEVRRELRSAQLAIDALEGELDQLRGAHNKLQRERDSLRETKEGRDAEVVNDLINTRMELAYAQEETIRLKNKLKKVMQKGPGSASFEK